MIIYIKEQTTFSSQQHNSKKIISKLTKTPLFNTTNKLK